MHPLLFYTFVVFLVIFAITAIVSLVSIIRFGGEQKTLITLLPKFRAALFSSLILEVVAVIVGAGYMAADKLYVATETLARFTVEQRQPSSLHDYVLLQRDIIRVRILGLNGLGVLHKYRRDLTKVLRRKGTIVEILLLDPDSEPFLARSDREETAPQQSTNGQPQFTSGRIRAEWEASKAVLRDVVNQLVHEHSIDIGELSARLKIKKHQSPPEYSFLFVDTSDGGRFLIYNKYTNGPQLPGTAGGSTLVYPVDKKFLIGETHFENLWKDEDTSEIRLQKLVSELTRRPS